MAERAETCASIFAIGNAHIDPIWIWDWREGMREVVATFTAAADRLDNCDDLVFTASSAAYYAWVEGIDSVLFERIKEHVRAGRWFVVGGEWVEPDCNLPSGESVCRQLLYSQRYLRKTFGHIASIGYNIDSFGHAASLPQLFRKGDLGAYVMMRPQQHEKALPSSLFRWRGIDGTELVTYRIPFAYTTGSSGDQSETDVIRARATALMERSATERLPLMLFFGVGDHGGGPTRAAIDEIRRLRADSSGRVAFSGPADYFKVALEGRSELLPVVEGDLHMHAVGCYSVVSWMKAFNARAERALVDAERLAAMAGLATGKPLDVNGELAAAWERVLFNQFHDSLGGTCTAEVFDGLREFYGYALTVADEVTAKASQVISARVDTWVPEAVAADRYRSLRPYVDHHPVPVVVFNPLSWNVSAPVVLPHEAGALTDDRGRLVTTQPVASGEGTRYATRPLARVEVPASGYRLFWLHDAGAGGAGLTVPAQGGTGGTGGTGDGTGTTPAGTTPAGTTPAGTTPAGTTPAELTASSTGLSNGLVEVVIDAARGAVMLRDRHGREWLAAEGLRPVVLDDPSDTWSHGVTRYEGEEQACQFVGAEPVEAGPVRSTVRLTYRWRDSFIYEDLYLYANDEALGARLLVKWAQGAQLLKLVVPVAGAEPRATVGLPYGAIERPSDGREEVMQRWIDVTTPEGGFGCISDVTYGYDLVDGRLRLTMLRSPRWADHGAPWSQDRGLEPSYTDQGTHRVSLLLVPHRGSWAAGAALARRAEEHCTVFPVVSETWHKGALPTSESFVAVTPDNVAVPVVKRAEDGTGWALRVVEVSGQRAVTDLSINGLARQWRGHMHPYEVKTLLFPDDASREVVEIDIPELQELH